MSNGTKEITLEEAIDLVRVFHETFGHLVRNEPMRLPALDRIRRARWMYEEVGEFLDADGLVDQADALLDLLFFVFGTFVEMGVYDLSEMFNAVYEANMAKLFPDGKPHYAPDGKVIKPEGWQGPEKTISVLLQKQMARRRF